MLTLSCSPGTYPGAQLLPRFQFVPVAPTAPVQLKGLGPAGKIQRGATATLLLPALVLLVGEILAPPDTLLSRTNANVISEDAEAIFHWAGDEELRR